MLLFNLKSFCNIKLTLSFQAALPGWQVFIRNLMEDSFVRHNKLTLWTLIKLGLHWLYKLKEHSTSSWGQTHCNILGGAKQKLLSYTALLELSYCKGCQKYKNPQNVCLTPPMDFLEYPKLKSYIQTQLWTTFESDCWLRRPKTSQKII